MEVFIEFKKEIENAKNDKELDFIFRRTAEQFAKKEITFAEAEQLRDLITTKKSDFKTEKQKEEIKLAKMNEFEKFRYETKLADDEFWQNDTIICKKCGTARSYKYEDEKEMICARALCKCQLESVELERLKEKNELIKRECLHRLEVLGINAEKYGLEKWKTDLNFQKVMLKKVEEFLNDITKGIIITGRSGCGKTMILSSAVKDLIFKGHGVEYLKWLEQGKHLKSIVMNDNDYSKEVAVYKNVGVLYIDDFLKVGKNSMPTDADISLAREIIDCRTEYKRPTIISTERSLKDILSIDESLGGRILELCQIRLELNDKDFPDLINYRLKF